MADEIVVGVSASATALVAVRWAARLARERHLPVTLVHAGRDAG
ncbi:universal stress protein, partial [Amycolatopsis rhizosphaerae]